LTRCALNGPTVAATQMRRRARWRLSRAFSFLRLPPRRARIWTMEATSRGRALRRGALHPPLTSMLLRFTEEKSLPLDLVERALLLEVARHALRHKWATDAVARKKPLDAVQLLLSHAALSTASIYTRNECTRSIEEVAKLLGGAS
jgi:hypothetical protein